MEAYQEILLIALGLSVLSALVSKFLANQAELKKARRDMEFYREKASHAQKSGDMKKSKEYMDLMLKASQSQFRHNLRPMMFSMVIFLLAIGWIGSVYGDITVPFADASKGFTYHGVYHNVSFDSATNMTKVDLNLDGQFSQDETFSQGAKFSFEGMIWKVSADPAKEVRFQAIVAESPVAIPFVGSELNWFWWYLIIILPSSMIFRKMLDIV